MNHRDLELARTQNVKQPEPIIGYEPDGTPTEAVCSVCGEWMPEENSKCSNPYDTMTAFSGQFKIHVRSAHSVRFLIHWTELEMTCPLTTAGDSQKSQKAHSACITCSAVTSPLLTVCRQERSRRRRGRCGSGWRVVLRPVNRRMLKQP